ncbi:IMPORTIN BETA [Salix purpurea]|uniref:IMPORTIN BETA n=1 Tax=Salix purpurea TaxID=77065 RepID=A0A9Q0WGD2_SALPP|nr:IMPORTIN BETA [Salix purpurea]
MASTTSSSLPQNSATPPLMSLPLLLRAKLRSTPGNPSSAINWSPPPISRLRPPSLGSQKSPLLPPQRQSYLSSTRDYLRKSSIKILNKIRHFVAKFATKEVRLGNDWPELLEFVYESLDSVSEEKVKYAVSLLYKLIPHCAVEDLVISLDSIYDSLVDIFDSDDTSLEVQVEAVLTSNRFLFYWTNRSNHDRYSVLMIEIVETISTLVEHKSDKDVQAIVKELTVLAKEKPWTLSSQFDYVVLSVIRILGEVELQDKTRILALEFVIALAEERVEGQQMLLGSQRAIPNIFEKILLLLANLKDDSEWEWAESDIQNLPSVRCLDRIVSVLGGEVLMKNFPRLFDINFLC